MIITSDLDLALREQTALIDKQQVFVLVDTHTAQYCLPILQETLSVPSAHVLTLPAGEEHKTLRAIEAIWTFLQEQGATRKSMLINLGGGVITDLGGFAASTYMRGIAFVNVPTTLLGMVDAAAGGKTGFDYHGIKNQIGVFRQAKETIVHPEFLRTLPAQQILSGFAEMVKHALISSPLEMAAIQAFDLHGYLSEPSGDNQQTLAENISRGIDIKTYIVESDPEETGMRQTLNFGHTIGHALEALFLQKGQPILHGYAVLYGLVAELYLSVNKQGLQPQVLQPIVALMKEFYGKPVCPCQDYDALIELMQHDKKNPTTDAITFTLLHNIGNYRLGCVCTPDEIREALDYLFNC